MSMMMKMTTLKLNLGQPMILYPRVTCIIAFAPSSVTLTHQRASSSSPILGHTHSATLVRSHSHPFPESNDQVEDLRVPDHWLVPTIALQESEWLRVTLHKWLDDEYCPEETNVEISRVAAKSYYNSLLQKQTDLGDILLNMARELESISYKESFHGAFSSANAAVNLIAQRIEQLWKVFVLVRAGGAVRALAIGAKSRGARVVVFNRNYEQKLWHVRPLGKLFHMSAYELVFDAVCTPQKALALQKASRAGAIVVSGVEVFIRQALGQFQLYTGGLAPEDLLGPYIVKES